ncbi:hypothetical protein [Pandoraea sp. SD6-2]|uniref:hypothetical protein n=1 Tax=Pandoraea sp. SD6-2 TaxID=1286093 RepID=UPI00032F7F86|nr:hypothetical protein [Pandoraea sp. SD6-2]EON15338.1 hypothetical protein C266_02596 [Pandoraea sp. SD6-2]
MHTLIGVVGEPQLWPMLAVAPSRTWHYASKYCRKGGNIHQTALGGYTIDGPYTKRRGVRALVARVLRFVGA